MGVVCEGSRVVRKKRCCDLLFSIEFIVWEENNLDLRVWFFIVKCFKLSYGFKLGVGKF